MASPQLDDGYTQVANEIFEALARLQLSSYEWRCIFVVLRKTYGWKKKEDWISLSQFVLATGISRSHVCRALKMLVSQNIITKRGTLNKVIYSFQKDYDKWKSLPKGARSHKVLPKGATEVVPKGAHTKETITKETLGETSLPESLKNKEITMGWNQYNENEHSDDLPAVDMDSREEVVPKKKTPPRSKYKKTTPEMEEVFDLFDNPAKVTWHMRELERVAAQALYEKFGIETLKKRIDRIQAEKNNKDPLFPLVVTPSQLLDKMPNVERYFGI